MKKLLCLLLTTFVLSVFAPAVDAASTLQLKPGATKANVEKPTVTAIKSKSGKKHRKHRKHHRRHHRKHKKTA
jgi:hypothetical protein